MLYLKRNIWNKTVFTGTEFQNSPSLTFYLDLENQQTLDKVIDIPLYDISTNPDRYNLAMISVEIGSPDNTPYYIQVNDYTSLINFPSGYYDYKIKDYNGNVLEIGKTLIEAIPQSNTTYSATNSAVVYDPNK